MHVLADENIPLATQAFSRFGTVETYRGRELTRERVARADILLVRSVTKVGAELLDGSRARFVGTATIGTDHVDVEYLRERGICFASAPGSNANSVAGYLVAALLELGRHTYADKIMPHRKLEGLTIGIVGVGNVGNRVCEKATALGMMTLLNDPPLQRQSGEAKYLPVERILETDIVTMHVPLTKEGPDATRYMADENFFAAMRQGSIFINTSRGQVVDEKALTGALKSGRVAAAALDVWEHEPNINADLLRLASLGTPHIAGYSYDGKVNGTRMIFEAACRSFGVEAKWDFCDSPQHEITEAQGEGEDALRSAVCAAYDIRRDDAALRKILDMPAAARGRHFERLRKEYPMRREFSNFRVRAEDERVRRKLAGIGFRLA